MWTSVSLLGGSSLSSSSSSSSTWGGPGADPGGAGTPGHLGGDDQSEGTRHVSQESMDCDTF